ncbi:hypothetical protein SK128_008288 [Halocaridina rubra]|uniref:Polyamine-modulated factor 1 n=1 Tax=Halocaridina rubra TaxID=373956 RepID=A0AAN8WRH8_HALRR
MSGKSSKGIEIGKSDSARLRSLKEALNQYVEKILGTWKPSVFAKCFPTLVPENEAILQGLRESLVDNVRRAMYEDLQILIDDHGAQKLNELSEIVKKYSGPRDVQAWRPSGDPLEDIRVHDAKILQHEKKRCLESLSQERQKLVNLLQSVKEGRDECQMRSMEIQKRVSECKEAMDLCDSLPKDYMIVYHEQVALLMKCI